MKNIILLAIIYLTGSVACTSLSTLQGARTTPKGEFDFTAAGGLYQTEITASGSSGAEGDIGETISAPVFDIMGRYGISDNFDVGLKYSIWSYGGDVKYKLLDGNFALALGLAVNISSFKISSGGSETSTDITDIIIPVYMNYDVGENGSVYFVPKSIQKSVSTSDSTIDDETISQIGLTLGYQFNKEKGFFVEYNYVTWTEDVNGSDETYSLAQPAVGYTW